jgi:hypothetical protein
MKGEIMTHNWQEKLADEKATTWNCKICRSETILPVGCKPSDYQQTKCIPHENVLRSTPERS